MTAEYQRRPPLLRYKILATDSLMILLYRLGVKKEYLRAMMVDKYVERIEKDRTRLPTGDRL